jgi:hypothetical protein
MLLGKSDGFGTLFRIPSQYVVPPTALNGVIGKSIWYSGVPSAQMKPVGVKVAGEAPEASTAPGALPVFA